MILPLGSRNLKLVRAPRLVGEKSNQLAEFLSFVDGYQNKLLLILNYLKWYNSFIHELYGDIYNENILLIIANGGRKKYGIN